jgi:probable rRNA maturation factor
LGREEFELGIHLVGAATMIKVNETYLRHEGSTDVITFNYCDGSRPEWMGGEIFVCVPEAVSQALRFRTSWQSEVVRYIVHAVLHLSGHDDQTPGQRRKMKREENRLLKRLSIDFSLAKIGTRPARKSSISKVRRR